MESHISATEAVRTFSDLLNRVRYRGEAFLVERGGEPVCRIAPVTPQRRTVGDLVRLLRELPRPDDDFLSTVEELTKHQPAMPKTRWPR